MRWIAPVLAALVVIGAGAFAVSRVFQQKRSAWEREVATALVEADSLEAVAATATAAAEELRDQNEALKSELEAAGRRTRQRVVEVRDEEVPESCAPFVAERDQVIDDLVAEADGWRQALANEESVSAELRKANAALQASQSRLRQLLEDRPRERSRWLPELGAGAFAGVDAGGRPTAGVGLTLSWRI